MCEAADWLINWLNAKLTAPINILFVKYVRRHPRRVRQDEGRSESVDLYTLTNRDGLVAKITNLGGHVTELQVPDRSGHMADIVLGHSTLDPYLDRRTNPYFGSIVGRYANRIAKGKFTLDGKQYTLDASSGGNHLHGGKVGFDLKDLGWPSRCRTTPRDLPCGSPTRAPTARRATPAGSTPPSSTR